MNDGYLYMAKNMEGLIYYRGAEHHFWLLADVSSLHSKKVINAIRDYQGLPISVYYL